MKRNILPNNIFKITCYVDFDLKDPFFINHVENKNIEDVIDSLVDWFENSGSFLKYEIKNQFEDFAHLIAFHGGPSLEYATPMFFYVERLR